MRSTQRSMKKEKKKKRTKEPYEYDAMVGCNTNSMQKARKKRKKVEKDTTQCTIVYTNKRGASYVVLESSRVRVNFFNAAGIYR